LNGGQFRYQSEPSMPFSGIVSNTNELQGQSKPDLALVQNRQLGANSVIGAFAPRRGRHQSCIGCHAQDKLGRMCMPKFEAKITWQ
jgi:hypothetical protein